MTPYTGSIRSLNYLQFYWYTQLPCGLTGNTSIAHSFMASVHTTQNTEFTVLSFVCTKAEKAYIVSFRHHVCIGRIDK